MANSGPIRGPSACLLDCERARWIGTKRRLATPDAPRRVAATGGEPARSEIACPTGDAPAGRGQVPRRVRHPDPARGRILLGRRRSRGSYVSLASRTTPESLGKHPRASPSPCPCPIARARLSILLGRSDARGSASDRPVRNDARAGASRLPALAAKATGRRGPGPGSTRTSTVSREAFDGLTRFRFVSRRVFTSPPVSVRGRIRYTTPVHCVWRRNASVEHSRSRRFRFSTSRVDPSPFRTATERLYGRIEKTKWSRRDWFPVEQSQHEQNERYTVRTV